MKHCVRLFVVFFALLATQTCFAGEPVAFETAYKNAKTSGRPMIVVLGAEWCPACVVLKNETIPTALKQGGLKNVELAHVNIDHQKAIATKLQRGPMIPQVVKMQWQDNAWKLTRFPGVPSVKGVKEFAANPNPKSETNPAIPSTKLVASVQ